MLIFIYYIGAVCIYLYFVYASSQKVCFCASAGSGANPAHFALLHSVDGGYIPAVALIRQIAQCQEAILR